MKESTHRVVVTVHRGQEEFLPEDIYSLANGGVWIHETTDEIAKLVFFTDNPSLLLSLLEKVNVLEEEVLMEELKDYESEIRRFFRPIRVGDLYVIPPWDKTNRYRKYIVIEPGMAFGTGRHESTRLMMSLMREIEFKSKEVIDLGCGSGILSIYASILGARKVLAIDKDEDAYVSAKKNVILNNAKSVEIQKKDIKEVEGRFDVILANLDIEVFKSRMDRITQLARNHAKVLFSGILRSEKKEFLSLTRNLTLIKEKTLRSWVAILMEKI